MRRWGVTRATLLPVACGSPRALLPMNALGMVSPVSRARSFMVTLLLAPLVAGCGGGGASEPLGPRETFDWVRQPISFQPPPARWYRDGDNGNGMLGVRFILRDGGGQCISVLAFRRLADRDQREAIARLIARHDSLSQDQFLRELSLCRVPTDDPICDREAAVAADVNAALDRAQSDTFANDAGYVASDLDAALTAAKTYEMTLEEMLPGARLQPGRMQEPQIWRIGYERDTTLAGRPAFASDDTLITPERPLLYHEVFWVVNGVGFKAIYQGTRDNLAMFHRVVESIAWPEPGAPSTD